jgi:hypothetical protein
VRNQGGKFLANYFALTLTGRASSKPARTSAEKHHLARAAVLGGAQSPAENRRALICPDDDRRYPSREQWSELQRDDRMTAESANHPLPQGRFSLWFWQAAVAQAALLHSCSDQQTLMRRMQERRPLLQFGPTSRTCDSVWFLYPCRDFDPDENF